VQRELAHLLGAEAKTIQKQHVRKLKNESVQGEVALTTGCGICFVKHQVREVEALCKVRLHSVTYPLLKQQNREAKQVRYRKI
jgi:hypothetical protein